MATIASSARGALLFLASLVLLLVPVRRAGHGPSAGSRAHGSAARTASPETPLGHIQQLSWTPKTLEAISLICSGDTTIAVTLKNLTSDPIDIASIQMIAGSAFVVQAGVPAQIAPNGQYTIGLKFVPPAQGSYRDTIQIYIPSGDPLFEKIPVQGRRETMAFATFGLAGDTIDFGTLCPSTPKDLGFVLTNLSTITTSFTGEIESPFAFLGDSLGQSYSVNGAHTVRMRFIGSPVDGTITAGLRIYDRCGRLRSFVLRAKVERPSVDVGPDTTICKGGQVVLDGEVTGGVLPYTYQWTPETGLNFPATARPTAFPDSTTRYILTVTDGVGCKGRDTMIVNVAFSRPPRVVASNTRPVCPGDTITLTADPYPYYLWSTGDTSRSIKVTHAGSYAVTASDDRGCSRTSDSVRVRFHARPASDIVGPRSTCPGNTETYSVAGGPGHSYSWSVIGGGSLVSGDGTSEITVNWASLGDWTLRLVHTIDSSGCTIDTAITVNVSGSLKPQIRSSGGSVICEGDSLVLSTDPYPFYSWSTGESGESIVVREPGRYAVAVTGITGCTGVSDTFEVRRRERPQPVIQGSVLVCANASLTYLVDGATASSFDWSLDGGGAIFNGLGTAFVGVRWETPGTWRVHVRQILDSSSCAAETTLVVTVKGELDPVIMALGPTMFCDGDSVTLDAGDNYLSYLWSNGDRTRTTVVRTAGDYTATVTAAGCTGITPPLHVAIRPAPVPSITLAGDTLRASPANAYQWYLDGAPIAGATSGRQIAATAGSYTLAVVDSNGCSGLSAPLSIGTGNFTVTLPADSARPGDSIIFPLVLTGTGIPPGGRPYSAEIRFNRTLLKPLGLSGGAIGSTIAGDTCILLLQGDGAGLSGDTLVQLSFLALLGNAEATALRIADFHWLDGGLAPRPVDGMFALAGLCTVGTPRLVGDGGSFGLKSITPNPSNGRASIVLDLNESTGTTLVVTDVLGRTVATLLDGTFPPGRYMTELDGSGLSSGIYYCILKSATQIAAREIRIVR